MSTLTKSISLVLLCVATLFYFSGCGSGDGNIDTASTDASSGSTGPLSGSTGPLETSDVGLVTHPSELTSYAQLTGSGQTVVKTYDNTIGSRLGNGYNSVKDGPNQLVCINYVPPTAFDGEIVHSVGQFQTNFNYFVTDSTTALAQKMQVSTGASASYGMFKGSASGDVISSLSKSSNSVYAYVYIDVVGPAVSLTDVSLRDEYKNKPGGAADIYEICGDYYAGAITSGGRLHAVIEYTASSESQLSEIKTSVSTSMTMIKGTAEGSIDVNSTQSLKNTVSKYSAKVNSFATGCSAYSVGTNIDAFTAAVNDFPKKTTECVGDFTEQKIMNMAATVTYFKMDSLVNAAYDATEAIDSILTSEDNLNRIIDNVLAFETLNQDLTNILNSSDQYAWNDPNGYTIAQLRDLQNDITKPFSAGGFIAELDHALEVCSMSTFKCA